MCFLESLARDKTGWRSTISHPYYVMKFENLDSSYFEELKRIGIEDPLPLPKNNITSKVE
jgi:hypothetical protein